MTDTASDHPTALATQPRLLILQTDAPRGKLEQLSHEEGFSVFFATSPEEILTLAAQHRPGAVFLQTHDPVTDPFGLTRALRASLAPDPPEVVLLYQMLNPVNPAAALEAGVDMWLPLPLAAAHYWETATGLLARTHSPQGRVLCLMETSQLPPNLLDSPGLSWTLSPTPDDFWQQLNQQHPDLLLIHEAAAGNNLTDLCRNLSADPSTDKIPLIVLTHSTQEEHFTTLFEAGADDLLACPASPALLLARIKNQLRAQRLQLIVRDRDSLTGALNRHPFLERAHAAVSRAWRSNVALTLVMIKPDRLRLINHSGGYMAGDHLLQQVSGLLQAMLRDDDFICRWSGGTFCMALPYTSRKDAQLTVTRLMDRLKQLTVPSLGQDTHPTFSAGTATFPEDGATLPDLLSGAIKAMDLASRQGDRVLPCMRLEKSDRPTDVVLAEDDDVLAQIILFNLQRMGFSTEHLTRQREVFDRFEEKSENLPRLLIVDLDVPGLDGPTLLELLRTAIIRFGLKLLLLIPPGQEEEVLQSVTGARVDYVSKPVSTRVLLHRLNRLLS